MTKVTFHPEADAEITEAARIRLNPRIAVLSENTPRE